MKQLILVRYGQYENGHLTEEGVSSMSRATERLRSYILGKKVYLLAAAVPRAMESCEVIGDRFDLKVKAFPALYAAEEEGIFADCENVNKLLLSISDTCDVVVAVTSREYIETLPSYIVKKEIKTELGRGECLVIDYETKEITYLKD